MLFFRKNKISFRRWLSLLFPNLCLYCQEPLEGYSHFCPCCLSLLDLYLGEPLLERGLHSLPLFLSNELSDFLFKKMDRIENSFFSELLAPLYFYQATRHGWENYRVSSYDPGLKRAFRKLQPSRRVNKRLFLSTRLSNRPPFYWRGDALIYFSEKAS